MSYKKRNEKILMIFEPMNELETYISSFWNITGTDLKMVASFFQPETIQKGSFYLKPGKICNTLSFMQSGLMRVYLIDDSGQEITQWIAGKGGFITDLAGMLFNDASKYYIQALTDCECYTINRTEYNAMEKTVPRWHQLEKLFIARCFIFMEQRIFSLLSMTAEDRYKWLFNYNPALFNEVPLQYLASMMGMSPETLSRIRKRISS